jgi:dienelactone hydrolase
MRTISFTSLLVAATFIQSLSGQPLPGTQPLDAQGDLAAKMVEGIDKYLMREIAASVEKRGKLWEEPSVVVEKAMAPRRQRLARILGVVDPRAQGEVTLVATPGRSSLVAQTDGYEVHAVRWPVLEGVDAEGLLLEPKGKPTASMVALPDADMLPEALVGLSPGVPEHAQFARRLAENGARVLVPTVIDRKDTWSGNPALGRLTNQSHREFIYRMAYQMGRHVIGYEVQKVLAAVDWLTRQADHGPVGIIGYGEGGRVALYSGALDTRVLHTVVIGGFGPREGMWEEPIDRNIWGLLREFGDGNVTFLYARRALEIEPADWPRVDGPPASRQGRSGAAPGRLRTPSYEAASSELRRYKVASLAIRGIRSPHLWNGNDRCLGQLLSSDPQKDVPYKGLGTTPIDQRKDFDPDARQHRQFDQLVNFTQKVMRDSEANRAQSFWAKLDTSSLEKYQASTEPFRKQLWEEILGKLPAPTDSMNPRSRLLYDEPAFKAYEVTLDLYPDVYAYGILCVPKDLKPGEKRAVVVCQHGLEGKPTDVVNPKEKSKYYNSFGSELAKRGYVVFAPQNPYIGHDKFRVLQRKANPLGLSIFSFIIRQHERILDWLATQPFVDPERMGFYGLSYGGKTAMRVPAVLPKYCLSICSGDFNEWTWKNASYDFRGSYMFSGEYEMPEFNLGQTIVYAEMAALIAPRPFMVERGHDDPVGIDEWVAYEYAKVRRLYSRLKIPERTTIEWFAGGHECHNTGTFEFLDKHLKKNW